MDTGKREEGGKRGGKKTKKSRPEERKEMLAKTVGRNTRERLDPFLDGSKVTGKGRAVLGVKRKHGVEAGEAQSGAATRASKGLVDYDSD